MKAYGKSGYLDPRIFDLRTSLRCIVSYRSRALYPRGKSSLYTLNRTLVGPHTWYGRSRENKNLAPTETRAPNPWPFSPVSSRYNDCPIPAPCSPSIRQLHFPTLCFQLQFKTFSCTEFVLHVRYDGY
jgi:hypothetical protein